MFRGYDLGKKNCLLSLNCFFDAGLARLDKGGWQAGGKTTVIYRDTRACVNFEQTAVQWQLLREKRKSSWQLCDWIEYQRLSQDIFVLCESGVRPFKVDGFLSTRIKETSSVVGCRSLPSFNFVLISREAAIMGVKVFVSSSTCDITVAVLLFKTSPSESASTYMYADISSSPAILDSHW